MRPRRRARRRPDRLQPLRRRGRDDGQVDRPLDLGQGPRGPGAAGAATPAPTAWSAPAYPPATRFASTRSAAASRRRRRSRRPSDGSKIRSNGCWATARRYTSPARGHFGDAAPLSHRGAGPPRRGTAEWIRTGPVDRLPPRSRPPPPRRPRRALPKRDTSHDACPAEVPAVSPEASSHALKTVFLIVLENSDWSSIEGNPSAPYINGTLLPRFAHAANHRNGGLHRAWATTSRSRPATPSASTSTRRRPSIPVTCHLSTYLERTGLTWKAYAEDLPAGLCPSRTSGGYAVRHDPFVYFQDVSGSPPDRQSAPCLEHVRPHDELAADLQAGTVARYDFIVPTLCDSGHDRCAPLDDRARQADAFLEREAPC